MSSLPNSPAMLDSTGQAIVTKLESIRLAILAGGTVTPLPDPPSVDGTYTLQCTVSDGVATYAWV